MKSEKNIFAVLLSVVLSISIILSIGLSFVGCTFDPSAFRGGSGSDSGSDEEEYEGCADRTVYAMDTVMTMTVYHDDEKTAEAALDDAQAEIMRLDALFERIPTDSSDTDDLENAASDVYRLNETGQTEVSADTAAVLRTALDVAADTDGAFDVTIAPIMDLWGFYGQNYRVPESAEIQKSLHKVNWENIILEDIAADTSGTTDADTSDKTDAESSDKTDADTSVAQDTTDTEKNTVKVTLEGGSTIDLGGIAKGYLSDRIAQIFSEDGIISAIISLGGNVYALGSKTDGGDWTVAVQNPEDDADYIATVKISDKAAVTSGSYQRYFEEDGKMYHHIIDPHTGKPAESGLLSVTIISASGVRADALSTAMFVKGLDSASDYWRRHKDEFDAIFVTTDGKLHITKGIEKSVETDVKCSIIT